MLTKLLPWIDSWIDLLSILTDPIPIPDSILDRFTICGLSPSLAYRPASMAPPRPTGSAVALERLHAAPVERSIA
jgi:hypothetical protein